MPSKRTLIIDTSSVLWMSLLAGRDQEFGIEVQFDGQTVNVNGWQYGLENAISHITSVAKTLGFNAGQMVFVVEGEMSKARRTAMLATYKASRGTRPPEAYEQFHECKTRLTEMFKAAGATVVTQKGVEGDDVIAYLCQKLDGHKTILSQDGDMAVLLSNTVNQWRNGALITENPYGPFPAKYLTVYKALVGDSSDNLKGAPGFGDKAFLNMLVWGGDGALAAMGGVIQRRQLHDLEDDVAEFKSMRKIIDGAESVYSSYACARLYPEWVNTERVKLAIDVGAQGAVEDERVAALKGITEVAFTVDPVIVKNHAIFDCELIGLEKPVFLVCFKVIETGERQSFWHHVDGDMGRLRTVLERKDLTWVSFNGIHFDAPLIWAALSGLNAVRLKQLCNRIITEDKSFGMAEEFGYAKEPEFDHIDLFSVAPGVKISLKAFAARMHFPTMVDLPFEHDEDLTPEQLPILESYCQNDLLVTEALFQKLRTEINLRVEMSKEYGIDLRSKSDPQISEAILKKTCNIRAKPDHPLVVRYKAPSFIETDSDVVNELIRKLEAHVFKINPMNGQVEAPEFLAEPIEFCSGEYQLGVGGLHSKHDDGLHIEADGGEVCLLDADVTGFYPNLMLLGGLTPRLSGGSGEKFISEYRKTVDGRSRGKKRILEIAAEISEIEKELLNCEEK